jgi:hypothetical protein
MERVNSRQKILNGSFEYIYIGLGCLDIADLKCLMKLIF